MIMHIKYHSEFKNPQQDKVWFEKWVKQVEQVNQKTYSHFKIDSLLGKTAVWGLNTDNQNLETLVIFPGARTSALFWDFDNNLNNLGKPVRLFMVETNGLPNSSDGDTPDIKSNDYGAWAADILNKLGIQQAYIAGASFGGLICMKLCVTNPEKVKSAFLLNPGCLQPFSLSFKNLYYNLLPIVALSLKNVIKFIDAAVFCKPEHMLSESSEKLIIDYEVFALTRYKDKTQKPYYMNDELREVKKTDIHLFVGDKDMLFPYNQSIKNAKAKLSSLKDVLVFKNVGHGIETYSKAIKAIGDRISA